MRSKYLYQLLVTALFLNTGSLEAQTSNSLGTFTPYSMFGIGELVRQGTPFNRSMGGIGVSLRDNRYINYINPASIVARDTLAFMLDFGVESQNIYHADKYTKSAYNTFNMNHIVFTFPLYKKSAMVVGFTPYSHIGYKFEEKEKRPEYVSEMGDVAYQHYGEGSVNQLFIGAAMAISKNFSVGVQGFYYFGTLFRNNTVVFGSSASHHSIKTSQNVLFKSFAGKIGLQYEGKINDRSVVSMGTTLLMPTNLHGEEKRLATTSSGTFLDTVFQSSNTNVQIKIPAEISAGVSFSRKYFAEDNLNRWMIGFDYIYQDWTKSEFAVTPGIDFGTAVRSAYKFGFEFTPDFFNTRYALKRWTYRGGIYHDRTYMKINGQQMSATGLTLGVSLPVFRWSNMVNFAIDMGQRGTLQEQLVRERFVMFHISISLYDRWFFKIKYE